MRQSSNSGLFVLILMLGAAALAGASLVLLPVSASAILMLGLLSMAGALIAILLPDSARVPYGLIYLVFSVAIVTRFLWPNFAYIPIQSLPTKNPQRMVWALTLVYWFYTLATNKELRERLGRRCRQSKISWLVLGLFVWRLITAFAGEQPLYSLPVVAVELFDYLPAFLMVLTWVRDSNDVVRLAKWLTTAAAIIVGFTVIEVIKHQNIFAPFIVIDAANAEFVKYALEEKVRGGGYRAQASFNHPLLLAQFMVTVLPLVTLSFFARGAGKTAKFTAGFVLMMTPFVIWATHTRSAYAIAALVIIGLAWLPVVRNFRNPQKNSKGGLLSVVALLVVTAIVPFVVAIILQLTAGRTREESGSSEARVQMFRRAVDPVLQNPAFGEGPGVGILQAALTTTRGRVTLDSYYLIVALDSGLPAVIAFIGLVIVAVRFLIKATKLDDFFDFLAFSCWSLAAVAFGVAAVILGTPHNLPLFYMCIGVLVVLSSGKHAGIESK
jgi:hypothetical protein